MAWAWAWAWASAMLMLSHTCLGIPYTMDATAEDGASFRSDVMPFNVRGSDGDPTSPQDAIGRALKPLVNPQHDDSPPLNKDGIMDPMAIGSDDDADHGDEDTKDGFFNMANPLGPNGNNNDGGDAAGAMNQVKSQIQGGLNSMAENLMPKPGAGQQFDGMRQAPSIPSDMMKQTAEMGGDFVNEGNGGDGNPESFVERAKELSGMGTNMGANSANPLGADMPNPATAFPDPKPFTKRMENTHVDGPPTKTWTEVLGFPTVEHTFAKLDSKFIAARSYWDTILQNNLEEDEASGARAAETSVADAEFSKEAVQEAGTKADSAVTADEQVVRDTKSASVLAHKVVEEDESIREAAAEAKRWMDKVLERSISASVDSKAAQQSVDEAEKIADETLQSDTELREQMKALYVQSEQARREADEVKAVLVKLKEQEERAKEDARKASKSLSDVKVEEDRLRDHEVSLRKQLMEQQSSKAHSEEELKEMKLQYEDRLARVNNDLQKLAGEKQNITEELDRARVELQKAKSEIEIRQSEEAANDMSSKKHADEQAKIIDEALAAAKEAKDAAAAAVSKEHEAEERAKQLEREKDTVTAMMKEKLDLAKQRTKDWLRAQTAALENADKAKDAEISRLKDELNRLHAQEVRDREQVALERGRREAQQSLLQQLQANTPKHVLRQPPAFADANALQIEEQAEPQTKQSVYEALQAAKAKLASMVGLGPVLEPSPGIQEPQAGFQAMDLERVDAEAPRLMRRRQATKASSSVPAGYPPPAGSARMQLQENIELDEGVPVQPVQPVGHGQPQSAQGVHEASDVIDMPQGHRDNCIKICGGGDVPIYVNNTASPPRNYTGLGAVYRDGTYSSPEPDQVGTQFKPDACMKLCAMYSIEVHEDKCPHGAKSC